MRQVVMVALLGLSVGGCVTTGAASVKGACDAFEAPQTVIQGISREDRRWIAGQVEAGVTACGWSRPKAREIAKRAGV